MMTCSICAGSAFTLPRSSVTLVIISIWSSIKRRSSLSILRTMAFKSSVLGCRTCLRLKASNWRTNAAARAGGIFDALDIVSQIERDGRTAERKIGVAGDDGEEIVEIVRDSAGEASHRFHFSRLLQAGFPEFCVR